MKPAILSALLATTLLPGMSAAADKPDATHPLRSTTTEDVAVTDARNAPMRHSSMAHVAFDARGSHSTRAVIHTGPMMRNDWSAGLNLTLPEPGMVVWADGGRRLWDPPSWSVHRGPAIQANSKPVTRDIFSAHQPVALSSSKDAYERGPLYAPDVSSQVTSTAYLHPDSLEKHQRMRNIGRGLAITGFVVLGTSSIMVLGSFPNVGDLGPATYLFFYGAFTGIAALPFIAIGVPLWATGQKKMNKITQMTVIPTRNGAHMAFRGTF